MAEKEPTPERQLLSLIENPKQGGAGREAKKRDAKKWFSMGALQGRLAFWKSLSFRNLLSVRQFGKSTIGVKQVNLILKVAVLLLAAYFGFSMVKMSKDVERASNLIMKPKKVVVSDEKPVVEEDTIPDFLEKIGKRNIFSSKEEPEPAPVRQPEPVEVTAADKAKDYALVGIAWSKSPEAMIEDKTNKRTYFVTKGQSVGEVSVVEIYRDYVVMSFNGTEFELK